MSCWRLSILQVTHNAIVRYWSHNSVLLLIGIFSSEAVFLNSDEDTNCERWKYRSFSGLLNSFWTYFLIFDSVSIISFKKNDTLKDLWEGCVIIRRKFELIRAWGSSMTIDYFGANLSLEFSVLCKKTTGALECWKGNSLHVYMKYH